MKAPPEAIIQAMSELANGIQNLRTHGDAHHRSAKEMNPPPEDLGRMVHATLAVDTRLAQISLQFDALIHVIQLSAAGVFDVTHEGPENPTVELPADSAGDLVLAMGAYQEGKPFRCPECSHAVVYADGPPGVTLFDCPNGCVKAIILSKCLSPAEAPDDD